MKITIDDRVSGDLARKARAWARSQRRMEALGQRLANELRDHFDRRNAQGNKKGWPRSNFWNRVVKRATSMTQALPTEATVTIASREFIHKLKGGTVGAKSGRMLAIPLRGEAKKKGSPGEWSKPGDGQLIFIKTRKGAFLFRNLGFRGRGRKRGQRLELWYKLVASVRHLADPDALPPRRDLAAALEDQLEREMKAGEAKT